MNQLASLKSLSNRYFVMRHGQSRANLEGIIASHAVNALDDYGLTEPGRSEIGASLNAVAALKSATRIISSDYLRARETAELAHDLLGCQPPEFDLRLRERDFGEFELGSDENYHRVWRQDEAGMDDGWRGVEGSARVMARVTSLVVECEKHNRGQIFLLVSHGDVLQILQTAFSRQDAALHRRQPHLSPAEIRELELASIEL